MADGLRLYAIGDIHGRADLLDALIDMIVADHEARPPKPMRLVFLGDLIDRGPESARVVERAIEIKRHWPSTQFLMGNHEEVFVRVLAGDMDVLPLFCRIGGRETILSYGISVEDYNRMLLPELLVAFRSAVPSVHRFFIERFEDMVIAGDYAFVHAGIRPGIPLEDQQQSDLHWIRGEFLDHRLPHDKIIVHGHSITTSVSLRPNRIGIDTGAYMSGVLTAMGFDGSDYWTVQTST